MYKIHDNSDTITCDLHEKIFKSFHETVSYGLLLVVLLLSSVGEST